MCEPCLQAENGVKTGAKKIHKYCPKTDGQTQASVVFTGVCRIIACQRIR